MVERCGFDTNKEEQILEQIIKGLRLTDEKRNLINKLNLTLKLAVESIKHMKL